VPNRSELIRCEDEDCFEGVVNNLFDPTSFTGTLIDTSGCTVSATVAITIEKVREIFIPNSFSPNGDGINDIFFINGGRGIAQVNSFQVFNRWGEVVFSDTNFQPTEIAFVDGFEELFSGDVTVIK